MFKRSSLTWTPPMWLATSTFASLTITSRWLTDCVQCPRYGGHEIWGLACRAKTNTKKTQYRRHTLRYKEKIASSPMTCGPSPRSLLVDHLHDHQGHGGAPVSTTLSALSSGKTLRKGLELEWEESKSITVGWTHLSSCPNFNQWRQ